MSNVVSSPAVIRSRIPHKARTAKVPVIAQAAINAMLSKQAGALMNYYMTETDGFAPAAQTVYMYTGLKKPKMIAARKELANRDGSPQATGTEQRCGDQKGYECD